jgi:hypothetical protein
MPSSPLPLFSLPSALRLFSFFLSLLSVQQASSIVVDDDDDLDQLTLTF